MEKEVKPTDRKEYWFILTPEEIKPVGSWTHCQGGIRKYIPSARVQMNCPMGTKIRQCRNLLIILHAETNDCQACWDGWRFSMINCGPKGMVLGVFLVLEKAQKDHEDYHGALDFVFWSFNMSDQWEAFTEKGLLVGGLHWSPRGAGRLIVSTQFLWKRRFSGLHLKLTEKKVKNVVTVRRISAYRTIDMKETKC